MKRPLFIISLCLAATVFTFNLMSALWAFSVCAAITLFSLTAVKNEELRAAFLILILVTALTCSFAVMKNERIAKQTEGVLRDYRMCIYEIKEHPKVCTIRGKLLLDHKDSINDVSIYLVPKAEYFPGDIINISAIISYEGNDKINLRPRPENVKVTSSGKDIYRPYLILGTLRERLNEASLSISNQKISCLFPGLLTGTKKYLTDDVKNALYDGGISHIAAVSGLHLSIILGAVFFVLPLKRRSKLILAALVSLFTMGISAFSPSVMRASLMALLVIAAEILARDSDGITSLSIFLIAVSIFAPRLLFSLSTWFSCLSVFGILHLVPYIMGKMPDFIRQNRVLNFLSSSLAVSFSSSLMTLPLCLYFFGRFSVLSIFLNVLVVPVISVVLPFLWAEVLLILLFGIHIPILDFLIYKICEYIIRLTDFTIKQQNPAVLGKNIMPIVIITAFVITISVLVFKKSSLRLILSSAVAAFALLCITAFMQKDDMYIFYPDSMSCAVVKNKEQAVIIGNLTKGYEAEILKSALRRYGVKSIIGVLADEDPSASAVMYEFLSCFKSPALDEKVRAVDFENFLPFDFLTSMGFVIDEGQDGISFFAESAEILKTKNKCVIITDMKTVKLKDINALRL